MTESFAYRGPDDEGFFFEGPVGLGHRRLSIIDLSPSGRQPMSNEDQTLWLVFNGEIYDFAETRKELVSRGHTLKSHTDTETVLHLYEEEGIACLKHLNGMFGFALWDARLQRLWLARDRLGKKPLVYYWDGKRLLFASEIKAILRDPEVPREIDFEALDLYLTLNYIPATWTIFKNIRKLLPGHYLLLEKGELSIQSYWDIPVNGGEPEVPSPSDPVQWNQCKERLRALLDASVRRRLIADVPLGAFLSGGIDSSIIVALMARHSSRPERPSPLDTRISLPLTRRGMPGKLQHSTARNTMSSSWVTRISWMPSPRSLIISTNLLPIPPLFPPTLCPGKQNAT